MFKKMTAFMISSVMLFSVFITFSESKVEASNDLSSSSIELYDEQDFDLNAVTTHSLEPTMGAYGVKSKAVIKVAKFLKAGGDEVIDAARTFNIIGKSEAKVLKNNSKKIGKYLDKFENAGEEAAAMIRKQLPVWLKNNTRMGKGTAENIAIAISWAVRGADWIFI